MSLGETHLSAAAVGNLLTREGELLRLGILPKSTHLRRRKKVFFSLFFLGADHVTCTRRSHGCGYHPTEDALEPTGVKRSECKAQLPLELPQVRKTPISGCR